MAGKKTPFAGLSRDTEGHFRLLYHAAVCRILTYVHRLSEPVDGSENTAASWLDVYPFLADYQAQMRAYMPPSLPEGQTADWWRSQVEAWEAGSPADLPLRVL